jgi:hypothetical protein
MDGNHKVNQLSLINSSLKNVYCDTPLFNYGIIRLIKFVSQFESGFMEWILSLIHD